jgi:hypothetical protein
MGRYPQIQIVDGDVEYVEGFVKTLGQQTLFDKDVMD